MKPKSTKSLRKKLWNLVSEYVRRSASNEHGIVFCYTCNRPHHWTDMDCGHYIHGDALDYEINNLRPQCTWCNRRKHGNLGIFCEKLTKEIGAEEISRMRFAVKQVKKWTIIELEGMIETYKQALENQKGGEL